MQAVNQKKPPRREGSDFGRRKSKPQQRVEGHNMLYMDYFTDEARYIYDFGTHYRMGKEVFMSILHGIRECNKYSC
jgi:hypothetical protein